MRGSPWVYFLFSPAAVAFLLPKFSLCFHAQRNNLDISTQTGLRSVSETTSDGWTIIKRYQVREAMNVATVMNVPLKTFDRLGISKLNLTVPVALVLCDSIEFPSLSKARKACRQKKVLLICKDGGKPLQGRVGDRVVPGDCICIRERQVPGKYTNFLEQSKPPFDLPVLYEDECMAIVNKPAGIYMYRPGGGGRDTIKYALPHILQPPAAATIHDALDRPELVHRLDRATSGLLVVAKTKSALVALDKQFESRQVEKTYHAIVYGIPESTKDLLSPKQSAEYIDSTDLEGWHLASNVMEGKQATSLWRVTRTVPSPEGMLSVVELKPKTGRYHQLRRQLAWLYQTPIVGDPIYGNQTSDKWHRGLMLCANQLSLFHPCYSSENIRSEKLDRQLHVKADGNVQIRVSVDLPPKFEKYLQLQQTRMKYIDA
jgi:RluA family pseudouridine synthase